MSTYVVTITSTVEKEYTVYNVANGSEARKIARIWHDDVDFGMRPDSITEISSTSTVRKVEVATPAPVDWSKYHDCSHCGARIGRQCWELDENEKGYKLDTPHDGRLKVES